MLCSVWCICRRIRSKYHTSVQVPSPALTASSILPTLATKSHWATELTATFMGTMCQTDVPPPDPDATATEKLEFLHTQLNGIFRDDVILKRFTLLGPYQRRQGGSQPPLMFLTSKALIENASMHLREPDAAGPRHACKGAS